MEAVVSDYTKSKRRLLVLGYNATLTTAVEAPRQPKRHFDQIQASQKNSQKHKTLSWTAHVYWQKRVKTARMTSARRHAYHCCQCPTSARKVLWLVAVKADDSLQDITAAVGLQCAQCSNSIGTVHICMLDTVCHMLMTDTKCPSERLQLDSAVQMYR